MEAVKATDPADMRAAIETEGQVDTVITTDPEEAIDDMVSVEGPIEEEVAIRTRTPHYQKGTGGRIVSGMWWTITICERWEIV